MVRKAVFLALIFFLWTGSALGGELFVFFLDVGEGEAVYIETPGREKILIDAGNLITGAQVVRFLRNRDVGALDMLIVTHPHLDHMGGVFHILDSIDVRARFDNGQLLYSDSIGTCDSDAYRWYGTIFRKENYRALCAGDSIVLGKVVLEVLSPSELGPSWNENSLVIKAMYGDTSFLFMGDAGKNVEKALVGDGLDLRAEVIKLGHHGSSDTAGEGFLSEVSPEYAVISIDKGNIRGYPDPLVVKRLQDRGIEVLTTYNEGTLGFVSDGKKVKRLEGIPSVLTQDGLTKKRNPLIIINN
jgi:competence protein ComEC